MRLLLAAVLLTLGCASAPLAPPPPPPATGALLHARVWTGDASHPWAEAVAWRDDRIVAVGTDAEITRLLAPGVTPLDARGAMAVPGFVDAHIHFLSGGASLTSLRLQDVTSKDAFVRAVADYAHALPHGAWVLGGRWDHTHWGGELPDKTWIDAVTPDNPVWIERIDGHLALANSAALRAAGVTKDTPDVPGGAITRDASGEPTGIFKDNALDLVERAVPPPTSDDRDRALEAAMTYAASNGVTSITSIGSWDDLATFERARAKRELSVRVDAVVPLDTWGRLESDIAVHGSGDAWVHVGGLKGFADGSLGAHTASMLAPFSDGQGGTGLVVTPEDVLYARVKAADAAGLHVMIHAIGDAANRTVLDVYERVTRENGPRDRRFRIEHAQHLAPTDVPRFGSLGVVASMQPIHCIDDGRWAESVIGPERAKTSYAFRSLLGSGAVLAFGSDWPVAPSKPIEWIYAAVTRRTLDGAHPGGWIPEQRISVDQALRASTWGGAYAELEEGNRGTLAPGKLADIVVIDRDLTRIPPESIADASVAMTVVGGRVVFTR